MSIETSQEERAELASEQRARRAARRQGYQALKSRWRRDSIDNHGGFMIVDPYTNIPVAGWRYDMSSEEVIDWCRPVN
jgi:hypothetical protein